MSADLEHIRQIMREADCLYTEAQVEEAIAKVGAQITREMADTNPVVWIRRRKKASTDAVSTSIPLVTASSTPPEWT